MNHYIIVTNQVHYRIDYKSCQDAKPQSACLSAQNSFKYDNLCIQLMSIRNSSTHLESVPRALSNVQPGGELLLLAPGHHLPEDARRTGSDVDETQHGLPVADEELLLARAERVEQMLPVDVPRLDEAVLQRLLNLF